MPAGPARPDQPGGALHDLGHRRASVLLSHLCRRGAVTSGCSVSADEVGVALSGIISRGTFPVNAKGAKVTKGTDSLA